MKKTAEQEVQIKLAVRDLNLRIPLVSEDAADDESESGLTSRGGKKEEERFLSVQADMFAGANVKEKASACFIRNDGGWACADRQKMGFPALA